MPKEFDKENKKQPNVFFCKVTTSDDYYVLSRILSKGKWIYRGQENSKWLLENSLERAKKSKETYINNKSKKYPIYAGFLRSLYEFDVSSYSNIQEFNAIKKYMSRSHQKNLSNIEALCNLQHYGGKTRLLDFTFSINVALFFAFENKYLCQKRCIWGINYNELEMKLKDPFNKYLEVACITKGIDSKKLIEDVKKLNNHEISDEDLEKYMYLDSLYDKFRNTIYRKNEIYKQIADDCIHESDKDTKCTDLILPIEMPDLNPRITAQNGLLLFTTSFKPFSYCLCQTFDLKIEEDIDEKDMCKKYPELYKSKKNLKGYKDFEKNMQILNSAKIIKIIFSEDFDDDRQILQASNINAYTIYPDNVGIAKSIEYW